jgi:hypothetical protein
MGISLLFAWQRLLQAVCLALVASYYNLQQCSYAYFLLALKVFLFPGA